MSTLQRAAKRLSLAWTPGHTTHRHCGSGAGYRLSPFRQNGAGGQWHFSGARSSRWAPFGLTLIYGILNFANIAHGDYMTVGAYLALFMVGSVLPAVGIEGQGSRPVYLRLSRCCIALPVAVAVVVAGAIVPWTWRFIVHSASGV